MKKKLIIIFIILFILLSIFFSYFLYNENLLKKSITKNDGDYVVLLHGLGRSSWSMQKIGVRLSKEGYKVININYPTRSNTIENLSEEYLTKELEKCTDSSKNINFITHSMGGIMVRHFLANNNLENLNKVIMLAPPNKGSEMADKWSNIKTLLYVMGPSMKEMTTNKESLVNTLPSPEYEVGIIAGELDKKVSVENTKLENMKDFLIVKKDHTFIMNDGKVLDAISLFLKNGIF